MSTTYYVKDGNTLVYSDDCAPGTLGVLAGHTLKGGHNPINGAIPMPRTRQGLRPATFDDFKEFRVCPVGHLTRPANMAEFHSHIRATERAMNAGCTTLHSISGVTTWMVAGQVAGITTTAGNDCSYHLAK